MDLNKLGQPVLSTSAVTTTAHDDRILWQRFQQAFENGQEFPGAWLALQCTTIDKVVCGCVVLLENDRFKPMGYWPAATKHSDSLMAVAEHALKERRGVVQSMKSSGVSTLENVSSPIAYPILLDDTVIGVAALEIRSTNEQELAAIMRRLQWGTVWIENFYRKNRQQQDQQKHHRLALAFQLSTLCFDHRKAKSAMFAIATEWAVQMGCDRVSIGFIKRRHAVIETVSHNANFDKRTQTASAIASAMDEAIDQKSPVQFPCQDTLTINRGHEKVCSLSGSASAYTVLMMAPPADGSEDNIIGAITIEHSSETFFSAENRQLCQQIALVIGPLLDMKRKEDEWIVGKIWRSIHTQVGMLIDEKHYGRKLFVVASIAITLFFLMFNSSYRVPAQATIEGLVQRHIAAPIDGYIAESYVRAGDRVAQGQPLFTLDNRDLKLEQFKWNSKFAQLQQQHLDALTQRNHTQVGILQAQMNQASAQLDLIEEKLNRTRAIAPFTGVIVKGDLSQELGSPVERGQSLMQISPLDQYRIILNIDEKDIADIKIGQKGELSLAALSHDSFSFSIEKITPVSAANEGVNRFRVEAKLETSPDMIRPGMQGMGKIEVGDRNLFWIMTHRMFDWIRIWIWSWWP
jgi:RND family efflux transporter MFP subunit